MAIYHCSTKTVNRSSGRTAVAASAYRSGGKLKDERTGLVHDFTKKQGIAHTEIITSLEQPVDRNELWNAAERAENRKDARTAREWVIALPDELDAAQRKELARQFTKTLVNRYGVAADLAIHEPGSEGDDRNHHAHILLTTRKVSLDPQGHLQLTDKAAIELSNTKRTSLALGTTQEDIKQIRKIWATLANHALERAGKAQTIDHRSYAEQNNGLQPTIHEGNRVTQLRRRGISTDISRHNDQAMQHNAKEQAAQQQARESQLQRGLNKAAQGFEQWQKEQENKRLEALQQEQIRQQQEKARQLAQRETQHTDKRGWAR